MEYSGQRRVSIDVLPQRVAYLVRSNNVGDFRRAVMEATTRWAGQTEPIIPVSPTGRVRPRDKKIAEMLQLDAAVDVGLDEAASARRAATTLGLPYVPIAHIDAGYNASSSIHPVNVEHRGPGHQLALPSSAALWELAAAGDIEQGAEVQGWIDSGEAVYRARSGAEIARAQLTGATPLARSMSSFSENNARGGMRGPVVLWFCTPNSLRDAVMFWNLRTLTAPPSATPMMLLSNEIRNWVGFDEALRSFARSQPLTTPDFVLASLSVPPEALRLIARYLGLRKEKSRQLSGSLFGGEPRGASVPLTYWVNLDPAAWLLHERRYGERTSTIVHLVKDEPTTVEFATPVPFRGGGGMVGLRIAGLNEGPLPQRDSVAQLFLHQASWRDGSLAFRSNAMPHYRFDLRIPSTGQIVEACFGRELTLSDKGRYAVGLQELVDPRDLLEPGVAETISALTTPRSSQLLRELKRVSTANVDKRQLIDFASEWGGRAQQRHCSAHQVSSAAAITRARATEILERLAGLGLAIRGLEVACSTCGMSSFVPMAASTEAPTCGGCRTHQTYVIEAGTLRVTYRLNSLVDRASDNGVLGHLLAIAALCQREPSTHLLPGVDVTLDGGHKAELDLVGFTGSTVIAGEVKLAARQFDDVARDIRLSKDVGADAHVLACLDDLPDEARNRAEALAKRNRIELIVLDRADLRPITTTMATRS